MENEFSSFDDFKELVTVVGVLRLKRYITSKKNVGTDIKKRS